MFRNPAASASQIDLGLPISPSSKTLAVPEPYLPSPAQQGEIVSSTPAGRGSTSTVASHASASTAHEDTAHTAGHVDGDAEDSERMNPDKGKGIEPEEVSKEKVDKAVKANAIIPAGAGVAAAALASGPHEKEKIREAGIEDKYGFFASPLRQARRGVYKVSITLRSRGLADKQKILLIFGGITLWLWICLPIFWGSVYQLTSGLRNLNVRFVTFDTDPAALLNGPITSQANYLASLPSSVPHLGWEVRSASDYPNGLEDVRREVLHQECWATVVVNANATAAWRGAIQGGAAGYDPNGAIGIYYMGARFYQVQYLYTEALIKEELMNPLSTARGNALAAFNTYDASNAGAIAAAALAPQTLGVVFEYSIFDLRPIQDWAWAGAAPMEASLIYFIIFAFIIVFVGAQARAKSGLEDRLTFRAKVATRIGWPLIAFFFLSLWETLIIRAFQVPLTDYLGRAGFVTLWALNYLTIMAGAFALETMLCIVGIPFLPVFLILWIILNITSSFYPLEMLPQFYRFLRWTPFLHNVEAFKIIAYGTNQVSRLGYHFGILFAVIGVEMICWPLAMVYERWAADRAARRKVWDERELREGA